MGILGNRRTFPEEGLCCSAGVFCWEHGHVGVQLELLAAGRWGVVCVYDLAWIANCSTSPGCVYSGVEAAQGLSFLAQSLQKTML